MSATENGGSAKTVAASLVLGICLVLSAVVVAFTIYRIKALDNTLVVTGSTKQRVQADSVRWRGSFSRTTVNRNIQQARALMTSDSTAVSAFLKANGFDEKDVTLSPVTVEMTYMSSGPPEYTLRQSVTLNATDLPKVTQLAKDAANLMNQGVFFAPEAPEYYYTKLPELRVSLLSGALADAKNRAEMIAKSSGSRVGRLRSASAGVVQVLPINSTDVADYGAYDTTTVEKEVTGTVRAVFELR
jgi:hypothetical protein